MSRSRVSQLLAVLFLCAVAGCSRGRRDERPSAYDVFCSRVTQEMQAVGARWGDAGKVFARPALTELISRSTGYTNSERFQHYIAFVKTFSGLAGVDPHQKVWLFEMGAREQTARFDWKCPALHQLWGDAGMDKACHEGGAEACKAKAERRRVEQRRQATLPALRRGCTAGEQAACEELARDAHSRGDLAEAEQAYGRLCDKQPSTCVGSLAMVYLERGKTAAAREQHAKHCRTPSKFVEPGCRWLSYWLGQGPIPPP